MEEFLFEPYDMFVEDLSDIVKDKTKSKIRVSGIFLTNHGRQNGKILGLLTPWDLPQ